LIVWCLMRKTTTCALCQEAFEREDLNYYTVDGVPVLACFKCAKTKSLSRLRCCLCKSDRFSPEELDFYEIDDKYQLVCGSCVKEHNLVSYLEPCSVCHIRYAPKVLHDSSLDGEVFRVCDKCRQCSICGDLFELDELWPCSVDGEDVNVCYDCSKCSQCGEYVDPNIVQIFTKQDAVTFLCSKCAHSVPKVPSGREISKMRLNLNKVEKTVKFKAEMETKNTVKYNEVPVEGQPPIIGTLYVQKWFAGNATEIEVTIRK
jgi:hypothetical protein